MDKMTHRRRLAATAAPDAGQQPEHPLAQHAEDSAQPESDPFQEHEDAETRQKADEDRQARLDAFGASLSQLRRQAIEARANSGIERIWREDEEHYEGVDDANRGEGVTLKPRDPNGAGGAAIVEPANAATGSTIFMPITRPYVDFSAGRAADMLLPTDDQNWDLQPTPMPDVIAAFDDERPMPPGLPFSTIGAAAKAMVGESRAKVAKAKKRIEDWFEEGQYNAEQRKVLLDSAKVGVGILKGPFPVKKVSRAVVKDEQSGELRIAIQSKTAPVSKRISYWNFYPAADCIDDIHKGSGTWEKDSITTRQLMDLKGTKDATGNPMYLEACIDACLEEGPQRSREGDRTYTARDNEVFPIWYYNGVANADHLRAAGIDADLGEVLPVTVTMVNDRVIKAELSTLDSGEFPYDVMVWQPREGFWAGIGVARQVRPAQRVLNGAVRNLMDNAGIAAGPQFVYQDGVLSPADGGDMTIRPRRFWKIKKDAKIDDVRKAFAAIELPMVTDQLMSIVQFALKTAEDATGIPMLMQGQQGKAADTVGGMQIVTNNSNTPMRTIAKQFDDRITVPQVTRYYEWLLMYGPEQDEKGEFIIAARGSSALFERDAQNQAILQMAPIVENPVYRINPTKWFAEFLRAQRLTPERFQYSDEEWAQIEEQQKNAPPPVSEKIEAANIAAQASVKREEIKAEVVKHRVDVDMDRDAVFAQEQNKRTEMQIAAQRESDEREERMLLLKYATQQRISLDNAKQQLARDVMKITAQKELAAMTANGAGPSREVSAPPTEPPGRAETGEAYQA